MNIKLARFISALAFFVACVWVGSYLEHQLPFVHWAKFPTILSCLLLGGAGAFVIGMVDVPTSVRRLVATLKASPQAWCSEGVVRVISLRTGNEVARFTCSPDAMQWVAQRYCLEGPHGPMYELRDRCGNPVLPADTKTCPDCKGQGKVPLNAHQMTTCVTCGGSGVVKAHNGAVAQQCAA